MTRGWSILALVLVVGCGGQQQEETPRTLPVEKVQVRVQLLDAVEGLDAALAGWATSQAVEVVTVVGDDGPTPSLVEIELEELDAWLASERLRTFPSTTRASDAEFWAGDGGMRGEEVYALPWRLDVVALWRAGKESAPLASWRELDAWIQGNGPLVLQQGELARALVPLVWSAGGAWADSLGHLEIATDPAREALSFLERLVTEERCLAPDALARAVATGQASMSVGGLALRATLDGEGTLNAFPPVEPDRGTDTVWLRPRAWAIPVGGPDAKLAADLAWHLATDPECLALLAPRHLPAYRRATPDPRVADAQALLPSARQAPRVPQWSVVLDALEEATLATVARRRSPGAALDDAERRIRAATVRSR